MNYLRVFLISIVVAMLASIVPSVTIGILSITVAYYVACGVTRYGIVEPATYLLVALLAAFVF